MPHKILMPALSPTMTEGKLARWLKAEGAAVKPGDVIAEIETDKATMEVEAVDEGTLGKILVAEGTEGVAVNTPIALLLEEGEGEADLQSLLSHLAGGEAHPAPTAPAPIAAEPLDSSATSSVPAAVVAAAPSAGRVIASPLAKRLARERGIDLSSVKGSGPHGRIVKADLEKEKNMAVAAAPVAVQARAPAAAGPDAKALADAYGLPYTLAPNSGVRKVIARRLAESKQTVPHFYLTVDCEIGALLDLRKQLNEGAEGYKLSVNDFIIKATALALVKFPKANVSWTDDAIVQYARADVSVAVATDNGLITPIIVDAASKSLKDISVEMKDLGLRAREGKLKPQEFQGGTISLSNLGMFGIREFSAIINPPQAAILAVGAGEERAVVREGKITSAHMMTVTASFDHRAIDGAVGAEYLQVFKKLIEHPMGLVL